MAEQSPESLNRRYALAAQVSAAMPELGWTICEALFMPMLLSLDIQQNLLTIAWLASPICGLFLHPLVGQWSDKYGRRPFIVIFGGAATVGLMIIPYCAKLPRNFAIPVAIAAFGLTDVSHDVLVTPSRAAMNDIFEAEVTEQRCAVISGMAKLFALTFATLLVSSLAFAIVSGVMGAAVLAQFIAPRMSPSACQEDDAQNGRGSVPNKFWLVWILQATGWLDMCIFSFYFTSVWAQRTGAKPDTPEYAESIRFASMLLICQAIIFIIAGFGLPFLTRICGGDLAATAIALFLYAVALVSFCYGPLAVAAVATVVLVPVAYQVVANTPLAWLEKQSHNVGERGRLTGWMNASLVVAQGIVAVGSGSLVQLANGELSVTFLVTAIVNIIVLVLAACWCLFRRDRQAQSLVAAAAET